MLAPSLDTIRIFLHVLAAAVWVGGQIAAIGVVTQTRKVSSEATKAAANGLATVAWPAYFVAIVTGIWNLMVLDPGQQSSAWNATFGLKFLLVVLMGVAAVAHSRTSNRPVMAATGAFGGVAALVTLFLGVTLGHPG